MKILGIGLIAFAMFLIQRQLYKKLWNRNLKVSVFFAQKGMKEGTKG